MQTAMHKAKTKTQAVQIKTQTNHQIKTQTRMQIRIQTIQVLQIIRTQVTITKTKKEPREGSFFYYKTVPFSIIKLCS